MKHLIHSLCLLIFCINIPAIAQDIMSDTWVGSDALGRTMPTSQEVGLVAGRPP